MTDVFCSKRRCLNNRHGWCKAKGVFIDGMCKSYAEPHSLIRTKTAGVKKRNRKYKQNKGCLK